MDALWTSLINKVADPAVATKVLTHLHNKINQVDVKLNDNCDNNYVNDIFQRIMDVSLWKKTSRSLTLSKV